MTIRNLKEAATSNEAATFLKWWNGALLTLVSFFLYSFYGEFKDQGKDIRTLLNENERTKVEVMRNKEMLCDHSSRISNLERIRNLKAETSNH